MLAQILPWYRLTSRVNQFLKLGVLVTRRVSEEAIKILTYASGYQLEACLACKTDLP